MSRADDDGIFVADDDGFLCGECAHAAGIDLGDEDVQTWEEGSHGWTGPCVCRGCKLSIPVYVDGVESGDTK